MSELRTLFLYGELGNLKICILPEEPFLTIPMVSAHKEGEELVFGNKALEKDESWQLVWLRDWKDTRDHSAFLLYLFQQPVVHKALGKCNRLVTTVPSILPHIPTLPSDSRKYQVTEKHLSVVGRQELGIRYAFNILGDTSNAWLGKHTDGFFSRSRSVKVGFDTIVNLFIKLLCEKGYAFTAPKDWLLCERLVMDYCYVALDFEKELIRIENLDDPLHEVVMEDGTVLQLGKECIMAPEVLFNPGIVGIDEYSIMALFHLEVYLLPHFPSVILCGGCAPTLKGLGARIQRELETIDEKYVDNPINIIKTNIREDALRYIPLVESNVIAP